MGLSRPDTGSQAGRKVDVLLTGDVDFSRHHALSDKEAAFEQVLKAGRDFGARFTLFFVAREAEQIPSYPRRLQDATHEVGCHGLTHGSEEEYDSMPLNGQAEYLREATSVLNSLSGGSVVSFRGPRVKISGPTLRLLSDMGYIADSTVCSQRFDVVSSNLVHMGWLRAPRFPYHPHAEDAYRRGDLPILEVPVSAMAVPFISSALYVLGVGFMKLVFRALYLEARRTGKPIVYLFHPYEFADEIKGAKDYGGSVKVHGFRFRRYLYRGDSRSRLEWNRQLWSYMASMPGVRFVTVSEYVRSIASEPS